MSFSLWGCPGLVCCLNDKTRLTFQEGHLHYSVALARALLLRAVPMLKGCYTNDAGSAWRPQCDLKDTRTRFRFRALCFERNIRVRLTILDILGHTPEHCGSSGPALPFLD